MGQFHEEQSAGTAFRHAFFEKLLFLYKADLLTSTPQMHLSYGVTFVLLFKEFAEAANQCCKVGSYSRTRIFTLFFFLHIYKYRQFKDCFFVSKLFQPFCIRLTTPCNLQHHGKEAACKGLSQVKNLGFY